MFGWSFSGDLFALILLLASVVNVVNGEKLLTSGKEELTNGQKEWSAAVHVDEYNQLDQCMPQPGHQEIYHHAIAFQLLPDQMNSGTGLITCYSGQLDRRNHDKGIVADILHRVNNVRGNELGNICESARADLAKKCNREKDPEQCEHFVEYPWHAIQLVEDPDGKNIIVHLSTTNQRFPIPREKFTKNGGRLFLKLANWDELRSSFSRRIGPWIAPTDFWVGSDCDHYEVYKNYSEHGALLRHHMGIWSIGLDMLPKDPMATELDFYVIRSKCSEMGASVLHPSEHFVTTLPNLALKKNIVHNMSVERMIFENSTLVLQGQVEAHVENMQLVLNTYDPFSMIECGSEDSSESKLKGLILVFNFTTGMTTLKAIGTKGIHKNSTSKNLLHPGQNFLIEVTVHAQSVEVSINCGPNVNFPVNELLPFNRPLQFTVIGAEIYTMQYIGADKMVTSQKYWQLENGIGDGRGIILQANMSSNWKKLKFTFIDWNMRPLLVLNGMNKEGELEIKWAKNASSCTLEQSAFHIDKSCSCFGLRVTIVNQTIEVKMDGDRKVISNITLEQPTKIQFVKMDADIIGEMDLNHTTWIPTREGMFFDLKESVENGDVVKITGVFFGDPDNNLTVSLIYFKQFDVKTAEACLNQPDDDDCIVEFQAKIELQKSEITISRQMYDMEKEWAESKKYPTTKFVPGGNFELKIKVTKVQKENAFLIEGLPEMTPIARIEGKHANVVKVSLDNGGMLFDEPKIVVI